MNTTPLFLGACLACALGGAVAGTTLGSAPVLDRPELGAVLPQSIGPHEDRDGSAKIAATPDHYPLGTPQGTVPVGQLSDRGLFSQARYSPDPYPVGRDQPDYLAMARYPEHTSDPATHSSTGEDRPPRMVATARPLDLKVPASLHAASARIGDIAPTNPASSKLGSGTVRPNTTEPTLSSM